jgi:hypothetical protein
VPSAIVECVCCDSKDTHLQLNVNSTLILCHALVDVMAKAEGSIKYKSRRSQFRISPGQFHYTVEV